MTRPFRLERFLEVLAAFGGLLGGLFLLGTDPILGVLVMLGSMALLLRSVASLCGAQRAPREAGAENDATD